MRGRLFGSTLVAGCLVLAGAGCASGDPTGATPGAGATSKIATSYMNAALDIMQANSINRYKIDWPSFRANALSRIDGATTTADTYAGLAATVTALGDNHSQFAPPGALPDAYPASRSSAVAIADIRYDPTAQLVDEQIGYISIPAFTGSTTAAAAFADTLQSLVKNIDAHQPCGWIVDLRFDQGGDMWPMIAGLGPILGEGDLGAFVDPDSVWATWFYSAGAAGAHVGGQDVINVRVTKPYTLAQPMPPVAVVYSGATASSGEAVAIAFRGRPLTRSFGDETKGQSTANVVYTLSDGAGLVLTTATDADRSGRVYGGKVEPDVFLLPGERSSDINAINPDALAWMHSQPACGGSGT